MLIPSSMGAVASEGQTTALDLCPSETMPPDIALAYASVFKAPQKAVPIYEPRWVRGGFMAAAIARPAILCDRQP
jgi:hypothetical protein